MKDYKYLLDKKKYKKEYKIDWLDILSILVCIPLGYIFLVILFCL